MQQLTALLVWVLRRLPFMFLLPLIKTVRSLNVSNSSQLPSWTIYRDAGYFPSLGLRPSLMRCHHCSTYTRPLDLKPVSVSAEVAPGDGAR